MSEIEKTIEHPLEDVLDIESGSTVITTVEPRTTELSVIDLYDTKDKEIEEQFQEIYDAALDAYESQVADASTIEPKYRARNQEVAVQYLNAALNAAKEKATQKLSKEKLNIDSLKNTGPKTVNQNMIFADRNEILKQFITPEED